MAEWLTVVWCSAFILLAFIQRLPAARRGKIVLIGLSVIVLTLLAAFVLPQRNSHATLVRDCAPLVTVILFYSMAGQFVTRADIAIERTLARLDVKLAKPWIEWIRRQRLRSWILNYLETAYLGYYLAMPLAIFALYSSGNRAAAGHFWTIVLLALFGSCSTLPFLQTHPPRFLNEKWSAQLPVGSVRRLNLWILRLGSIHANTCPSAHVAIASSCALVLIATGPEWAAICFSAMALSIALGAVAGRYHYATDALLGFVTAGVAFVVGFALPD